jgi:phosphomethylpyrimidine synthase
MCGPKFCSMELTQQIRAGVAALPDDTARKGMDEKSLEFRKRGEVYVPRD